MSTYVLLVASPLTVANPRPVILLVPIAISPVIVPPANGNFVEMDVATVVAKLGSFPSAAANSFRVSKVPGAEFTRADSEVSTYDLFAASVLKVHVAKLVNFYVFIDTDPDG